MIAWPFRAVAGLIGLALRLAGVATAFALMVVGLLISLTVIGSVIGIPVFVLGVFVLWKALRG
jgi:hypothetical protein